MTLAGPRWPLVVSYLLTTMPTLTGWDGVGLFDTDAVTTSQPATFAVVVRTRETAGSYSRSIDSSTLIAESGVVRLLIGARGNKVDASKVRNDGFALATALEAALLSDHTFGGLLGATGTVSVSVDVQSTANPTGTVQALVVAVNYTSLT